MFITRKLTVSVGEIVNGGPLPPIPRHTPVCSFNSQNKYIGESLAAELPVGTQRPSLDTVGEKLLLHEGTSVAPPGSLSGGRSTCFILWVRVEWVGIGSVLRYFSPLKSGLNGSLMSRCLVPMGETHTVPSDIDQEGGQPLGSLWVSGGCLSALTCLFPSR